MYNMRATDRFIVPKMNTSFRDATFINFFSRFANHVLSDLICLPEGEFGDLFNKDLKKFFGIFKKNFDWLTFDFGVSYHNNFILNYMNYTFISLSFLCYFAILIKISFLKKIFYKYVYY